MSDNEYDDDVFDHLELDDDDVFDDIDEDELVALERPAKRVKTEASEVERNPALGDSHSALAERILSNQLGFKALRHEQAAAIQHILKGDNVLVIFPTGAGKSLCYQIPSIAFPELDGPEGAREPAETGVTIVVSPLVALMKDQVDVLKKRGIPAESIDSSKTWEELQDIPCSGMITVTDLVLRIRATEQRGLHRNRQTDSWRHPACRLSHGYGYSKVAEDICKAFSIQPAYVFRTTPYRPNFEFLAKTVCKEYNRDISVSLDIMRGFHVKSESDKRFEELFRFLRANPGPTLIYVAMQQQSEIHAKVLAAQGFKAAPFHAGLKTEVKQRIQDDFLSGKVDINSQVCVTIAFGMGIDKPDIRNVVHWDLSNTVEEYSQQIGRAGWDGKPSKCMFYLAPSAFYLREVFARGDLPSRSSLAGLVFDIFKEALEVPVGGVFKTNHCRQQKDFDIRPSTVSIIYATLELHFGFIRATTSEYSTYKFEAMPPVIDAIYKNAKKKLKWYDLDVNEAASYKNTGLTRGDIVAKLNQLDQQGHIRLKASGLMNRYIVQKALPRTHKDKEKVVDKLYKDSTDREKDALQRCKEVMSLITGSKCFALSLAQHFGMGLPKDKEKQTNPAPQTHCDANDGFKHSKGPRSYNARDDPRFLARVAYGIRSPRVTALKLDKSPVFRSLAHHDFEALLAEFTKACEKKINK
ncbi:hypothetical protein QC761_000860 [Podospora bellae-mahoneyi]|uniref:DNA 3'-5' helicase n=1 Tax=Podospora bellae-mahoneyi TaxID=2093777 RepID=A0ABR0FQC7_9PEZI|nr:hypothetical protein QC761_000860 [Podospora bellae-mahoneyi]